MGASVIVGRAKPDGCDIKPVGEVLRCELSGNAFCGDCGISLSAETRVERGAEILNPPPIIV